MLQIDTTAVSLQNFYPENLIITSIDQEANVLPVIQHRINFMLLIIKKFRIFLFLENVSCWTSSYMNFNVATLIVAL